MKFCAMITEATWYWGSHDQSRKLVNEEWHVVTGVVSQGQVNRRLKIQKHDWRAVNKTLLRVEKGLEPQWFNSRWKHCRYSFSLARGRGCLTWFKEKRLQVQVCASHLHFIVILLLCGTAAEHQTLHSDSYTLDLAVVSKAVESEWKSRFINVLYIIWALKTWVLILRVK